MTAVGGPLVVAACTEFTSLILLRFIEERDRGLEPKLAVEVVASRTGRAFIVSGPHRDLRRRGAVVLVAAAAARLRPHRRDERRPWRCSSALVVLPPMLVWADKRNWVSRGMLQHRHEPFIPTAPEPQPRYRSGTDVSPRNQRLLGELVPSFGRR